MNFEGWNTRGEPDRFYVTINIPAREPAAFDRDPQPRSVTLYGGGSSNFILEKHQYGGRSIAFEKDELLWLRDRLNGLFRDEVTVEAAK